MKKPIATVLVTLLVILLAVVPAAFAWDANMEADHVGMGYFGVFMPVFAVIAAFCTGRAAELFSQTVEG